MNLNIPFEFATPLAFLLLLSFIPLALKDYYTGRQQGIPLSDAGGLPESTFFKYVQKFLSVTKYLILFFLITALARPRTYTVATDTDDTKGVDIMLSVDVSLSMLAQDLEPDRLTALKDIAVDFVSKRQGDRIGLVSYSGEAYTKVPLTSDHEVVKEEIKVLYPSELAMGTSIGDGLSVAVSHLQHSKAKSKIIILMTDGVNTVENVISAQTAAKLAADSGIKVYTIGIGTNGYALMPTRTDGFGDLIFEQTRVTIDEPLLREVSDITGGKYYRTTSKESLQDVYAEINSLEKTLFKASKIYTYTEYFRWLLLFAGIVFVLDLFFRWVVFKKVSG